MAVDWNSKLSYNTSKVVTMRDWRLGLIHYICMAFTIVYVMIYTILIKKNYLALDVPIGTVRLSLQQGPNPPPATSLDYCRTSAHTMQGKFQNYACQYYDAYDVIFPIVEQSAMFATTRLRIKDQYLNCSQDENSCTYTTTADNTFYVAALEDFTLLLDHTMYAPTLELQTNAKELKGRLIGHNGEEITSFQSNEQIGVDGKFDILRLSTLMKAGGLNSLDDTSDTDPTRTRRYDGIVLLIWIDYSNTFTYNLNNFRYTYEVAYIKDTEFKTEEPVYEGMPPNTRQIWNRHGIRMVFIQGGKVGKFDFQVLLLQFVSGLGLLAIATIVVDFIALNVVPQKGKYNAHKYELTDEYERMANKLEKYRNRLRANSSGEYNPPAPTSGLGEPLLDSDDDDVPAFNMGTHRG